jgi:hypothetical protein
MMERMNSSMIYMTGCKNFCKCHNVSPASTTIKKEIKYRLAEWKKKKKIHGNKLTSSERNL